MLDEALPELLIRGEHELAIVTGGGDARVSCKRSDQIVTIIQPAIEHAGGLVCCPTRIVQLD
jgi:hypothetical protein